MTGLAAMPELLTRHRHSRAPALAAIVALALLLLLILARLIWSIVDLTAPPELPPSAADAAAASEGAPAASVAQWHLFGNVAPAFDPRSNALAPETTLELTLLGVFASEDPARGHAIIADARGEERSYRVGEELPGGVLLDAVHADRVLLSRGGVIEALRLPRADAATVAGNAGTGAPSVAPVQAGLAQAVVPAPGAPAPFVNPVMSFGTQQWSAATSALGVDVAELARQVTALPVMENGRFAGVRLSFGRDLPLAAKLGLEPDDVVTAINGMPLDSLENAQLAARSLATQRSATVTVRRGGESRTLSVSLN
jgi:general secretion pathway protein C